jgi:hypothetical protein
VRLETTLGFRLGVDLRVFQRSGLAIELGPLDLGGEVGMAPCAFEAKASVRAETGADDGAPLPGRLERRPT